MSHVLEHGGDVGVESCTRTAAPDWYFASGTTVDGSQHDVLLFNPFGDDAIVDVSFITDTGTQEPAGLQALVIPRRSRVTIPVQDSVLRQTARRRARARSHRTRGRRADAGLRRRRRRRRVPQRHCALGGNHRAGNGVADPRGEHAQRWTRATLAGQLLR